MKFLYFKEAPECKSTCVPYVTPHTINLSGLAKHQLLSPPSLPPASKCLLLYPLNDVQ
jgi:hypothetical protein